MVAKDRQVAMAARARENLMVATAARKMINAPSAHCWGRATCGKHVHSRQTTPTQNPMAAQLYIEQGMAPLFFSYLRIKYYRVSHSL